LTSKNKLVNQRTFFTLLYIYLQLSFDFENQYIFCLESILISPMVTLSCVNYILHFNCNSLLAINLKFILCYFSNFCAFIYSCPKKCFYCLNYKVYLYFWKVNKYLQMTIEFNFLYPNKKTVKIKTIWL